MEELSGRTLKHGKFPINWLIVIEIRLISLIGIIIRLIGIGLIKLIGPELSEIIGIIRFSLPNRNYQSR